jgi:hypothetical protein
LIRTCALAELLRLLLSIVRQHLPRDAVLHLLEERGTFAGDGVLLLLSAATDAGFLGTLGCSVKAQIAL